MKRLSLLFALVVGIVSFSFLAGPAEATHYGYGCPNVSTVRAFTFQPTYTVQSFAYATYQPFTLYALPPVVQVQKVEQKVEVPAVTYEFKADPCPQTALLFQAAPVYNYGYSTFAAGPSYDRFTSVRFRNSPHLNGGFANVNVNVNAGRFRVRDFNDVNVKVRANGFGNGATVIQQTEVNRRGLFGLQRDVKQTTTVINGGNNVNVQTFQRSRLRR